LIPYSRNSNTLKSQLKAAVGKMAPYRVHVYTDGIGGKFAAIDVGSKPELLDMMPEVAPHEATLIKKIQSHNPDVQLVVRERSKTPDLIVGGLVTEIKSLLSQNRDLSHHLDTANLQVLSHARRHHLGRGAVAVDYTHDDSLPIDFIAERIDLWRRHLSGANFLDKIFVFAGGQMKAFVRQGDGSYKLRDSAYPLDGGGGGRRVLTREEAGRLITLAREGRLSQAWQELYAADVESDPLMEHARDTIEAERVLQKVRNLVSRGNPDLAGVVWRSFTGTHSPQVVESIQPRIDDAFGAKRN
jgi:hypothetical protein